MKLSYFQLLSPYPVYPLGSIGFISPKLRDIASIGTDTYQYYLSMLSLNTEAYFTMLNQKDRYDKLTDTEKSSLNIFDLLTLNEASTTLLQTILNFFTKEDLIYSATHKGFIINNAPPSSIITKETYPHVCDIIFQLNYIKPTHPENLSEIKNKKAKSIMQKLQKGRLKAKSHSTLDKNMDLANIISAVASKSPSLNILTIWDLTIYQLWDCFHRLTTNDIYSIQSMSVAAWGSKDNKFTPTAWYTNPTP